MPAADSTVLSDDPLGDPNPLLHWLSGEPDTFGLGNTSELANWIGRVINAYCLIEYNFYVIFSVMNDASPTESYRQYYSARTINLKDHLLLNNALLLPDVYRRSLVRLCRTMRGAADRRTQVAHCTYVKGAADRLIRVRLIGKKCFFENVGKEFFVRTIEQFRTLLTDVKVFLFYLGYLIPKRHFQTVTRLPLPRRESSGVTAVQLDHPQPHVEAALLQWKHKIGLGSVLVMEDTKYPRATDYDLYYDGYLVLPMWVPD